LRQAGLLIALLTVASSAAAAPEVSITATYEAQLLIKVADLRTDQVVTAAGFRAGARLTSIGALGVIRPAAVLVQSNGAMSGFDPRPGVYQQTEKDGQKHRVVRFAAPTPVDPLTGFLRSALQAETGSPCTGLVAVWDGRQRYDLVLSPLSGGRSKFNLIHPMACRLAFRPIAGFSHGPTKANPFLRGDPTVSFAYEPRAHVWVLTDIAVPTIMGAGHVSLTALHVNGARPDFIKPSLPPERPQIRPAKNKRAS